jgi:hypothetical protein
MFEVSRHCLCCTPWSTCIGVADVAAYNASFAGHIHWQMCARCVEPHVGVGCVSVTRPGHEMSALVLLVLPHLALLQAVLLLYA